MDGKTILIALLLTTQTAYADSLPQASPDVTADTPAADDLQPSARGHGSISIAYLDSYVNGFWATSNFKLPNGAVRSHGVDFDLDYFFADAWSVHVGIPYLSNEYDGMEPHCPTTAPPQCAGIPPLNPQHPESQFIDDGKYHGAWQDFSLGVAWHTNVNDYYITPSVTATIPSHEYVFFDNAAVGQRLYQLLVAATLAHQFEFTNLYFKLGAGYAFSQHVLGYDTGYKRFDAELGYFLNEKFSVRTFFSGRYGNGVSALELLPRTDNQTNALWYHHDQISEHTYYAAGVGFDYAIGDRYTLTAGVQHELRGDTVFDFKYALEVRLTRSF